MTACPVERGKRPQHQRKLAPHSNKARLPHHQYLSWSLVGEKNHPPMRYRDKKMPLVSYVDTVYYTPVLDIRLTEFTW